MSDRFVKAKQITPQEAWGMIKEALPFESARLDLCVATMTFDNALHVVKEIGRLEARIEELKKQVENA